MSFLDLYQGDQAVAMKVAPNEGHDLPATFGESYDAAWNYGRQFANSNAGENARMGALQDYIDGVREKTGVDISPQMEWTTTAPGVGPVPAPSTALLDQANTAIGKMKASRPDLDLPTMDQDGLEQAAVAKSRAAGAALAKVAGGEHSGLGLLAGGLTSAATDPINVLALPVAPETESVSILNAALRWGAVGGIAQAGVEVAGAPFHEEVQPGYLQSGAPVANVLEAIGGGAVLGGGTRGLGNLWTKLKTGAWPTSVRDAGNLVESHANIQDTNVYLGAEGEAAHWDAMNFAIDNVVNERPVDVTDIITPQMEAQSRNLMAQISADRAASLPAFNQRTVALLSEEAGLRSRDAELATHLGTLPEVNETATTAADRLNRLQTVDQQLQTAEGAARKRLQERRDQILVDTAPERLQAEAAPLQQRRTAEGERARIADRLNEIEQERAAARTEGLIGVDQPMIGQQELARPMSIEDLRRMAGATADIASTERATSATGPAPELPFQATASEATARASAAALSDSVSQVAARAGYAMPKDEADRFAAALAKMAPEEAQDALRSFQISPRQAESIVEHGAPFPETERPLVQSPESLHAQIDAPDHVAALQADIDRERVAGDRQIPIDVDKDGNPVYRSLDGMADEVEAYQKAADQIAACAAPAAGEEAA